MLADLRRTAFVLLSTLTALVTDLPCPVDSSLHAGAEAATVTCLVVDGETGQPLAARCRVTSNYGVYYPPVGTAYRYSWGGGFFYADGAFEINLWPGEFRFRIGHGFEHEPVDTMVVVGSNDTTLVLGLGRIVDMEGLGWYGGDCHLHIDHGEAYYGLVPANVHMMGRAEGLRMVNCLDNGYFFTGGPDPCSTEECIVYMTEEFRSSVYGHMGLLGLEELVSPISSFWWPTTREIADSAHTQEQVLVISAHPVSSEDFDDIYEWPGSGIARALPVDLIDGAVDAFEVMNYSNCHGGIELDMWYRLLNSGFELPGCGGSDACMNMLETAPLGGFRTYAAVAETPFSSDGWIEGVRSGRTFVTNGPLITEFDIGGAGPGESVEVPAGGAMLSVELAVECIFPLDRAEIVRNGDVVWTASFEEGRGSIDTSFSLFVEESSWFAARVYGPNESWLLVGDSLFAHSGPVYTPVEGIPVIVKEDAVYLAFWTEELGHLVETEGAFIDTLERDLVLDRIESARRYYLDLAFPTSDAGGEPVGPPLVRLAQNVPNPFNASTTFECFVDSDLAGGMVDVDLKIYDVSGTLVREIYRGPLGAGCNRFAWDGRNEGGTAVASGIYFLELEWRGTRSTVKMIQIR